MFKPNQYNGLSFILKIEKSILSFILKCTYINVKLAASTTFPLVKKSNIITDTFYPICFSGNLWPTSFSPLDKNWWIRWCILVCGWKPSSSLWRLKSEAIWFFPHQNSWGIPKLLAKFQARWLESLYKIASKDFWQKDPKYCTELPIISLFSFFLESKL